MYIACMHASGADTFCVRVSKMVFYHTGVRTRLRNTMALCSVFDKMGLFDVL